MSLSTTNQYIKKCDIKRTEQEIIQIINFNSNKDYSLNELIIDVIELTFEDPSKKENNQYIKELIDIIFNSKNSTIQKYRLKLNATPTELYEDYFDMKEPIIITDQITNTDKSSPNASKLLPYDFEYTSKITQTLSDFKNNKNKDKLLFDAIYGSICWALYEGNNVVFLYNEYTPKDNITSIKNICDSIGYKIKEKPIGESSVIGMITLSI